MSEADRIPDSLLLHACCGPCAVWPAERLFRKNPRLKLHLWFYNPNIQPLAEFRRRRDGLAFAVQELIRRGRVRGGEINLTADFTAPYDQELFLARAAENPRPPQRCRACYELRLAAAAREAAARGVEHFSTTLLFSRQQKHDLILDSGRKAAGEAGRTFYYEDFRTGWKEGQALAREMGLYRQNFCGCIYGAQEQG
jgi:predicted adenine nucleotide alpha hydrolase (AANH) superfamily ATPase